MVKCPHCKSQMNQLNAQAITVSGQPSGAAVALTCNVCDTLIKLIFNAQVPNGTTAKGAKDIVSKSFA